MHRSILLGLSLVAIAAPGCQGERDLAPERPKAVATDWCTEHAVPESKCTVCSPALAASFQAAGDWCASHGFPESVCPQCNPLEPPPGAPAARAAEAGPPADGTRVVLEDLDVARRAALTFATAAPGEGGAEIVAPVTIVYDAARHAAVTPRSPGVVRDVRADLGTTVRPGTPLVVIESAEVGADRSRVAAAGSHLSVAENELRRADDLHRQGIVAARDVQLARQERDAAEAEVHALEAATAVAGPGGSGGRYVVSAPIAGVVVRRAVSLGASVDAEDVLLEVADTSVVWAEIELPEADAASVRAGHSVAIELDALPGRTVRGVLHWIAPEVDARTRTATARVRLGNADGALRAGMYGRARLTRPVGPSSAVLVPRDAVQRADGVALVFVVRDARTFVVRRVDVGGSRGSHVAVVSGLAAGERVVVDGAFLLKTETMKGSIGAGCCE